MVDSLCRFHVQSSISLSGKLDIFIIQRLKGKKKQKIIKVVDMLFLRSEEKKKSKREGKKIQDNILQYCPKHVMYTEA
jgi:hypothetical protein